MIRPPRSHFLETQAFLKGWSPQSKSSIVICSTSKNRRIIHAVSTLPGNSPLNCAACDNSQTIAVPFKQSNTRRDRRYIAADNRNTADTTRTVSPTEATVKRGNGWEGFQVEHDPARIPLTEA